MMKISNYTRHVLLLISGNWLLLGYPSLAATTNNVSVGDNFFNPSSVTIQAGDSVKWTWNGFSTHSSTGPGTPALWDSGLHTNGWVFTRTFSSAGSFAYRCVLHAAFGQTGTVNVQPGQNVPPTVAIAAPTNGAVFAAPWTGTIQASNSDSDGSVTKVDFFMGATLLGTVSNPPANVSFTVTNLAAGNYVLTAVATDNLGTNTTSAGVNVQVLTPAPISLSTPERLSPSSFQFRYSTTPGLRYVIQRSVDLPAFTALTTNTATVNPETFTDNSALGPYNFYSVRLLPNP